MKWERLVFVQDFLDANPSPKIEAQSPQPGFYNFFVGNDPARWHTRVRAYAEVIYRQVWKGVDVRLHGNGPHLEQEFIVRSGADPRAIRVAYRGIEGLRVAEDGALVIDTTFGPLHESRPRVYQEIQGERVEVAGWFKLLTATTYTFELGPYHPQYALLIDPTLSYSTYLGGSGYEFSFGIAVDSVGDAYVTGETGSSDFPTTAEAFQPVHGGDVDAFVTKLNSTGSALVYSTYLGGSTPNESGSDITVDAFGHAYVTGVADAGFPTTEGTFQPACSLDAFVTKLSPDGSTLIYSTCLGGSVGDGGSDIAVDAAGHVYVVGGTSSTDFPTVSPLQPPCKDRFAGRPCVDGFVAKLSPTGSAPVYSTLLGGIREDPINGVALDGDGHAYMVGATRSPDLPTTTGAFQPTYQNMDSSTSTDAFVAKIIDAATSADASVTLAGSPNPVHAGDILTYTATVVNSGPEAAPAVTLSSNIQTDRGEVIVVSTTASQGGCIQDAFEGGYVNVTCRLRDLAAGASATAVMQVRPTSRGGIGNTAVVSSGVSDPELATNIASTDTRVKRRGRVT